MNIHTEDSVWRHYAVWIASYDKKTLRSLLVRRGKSSEIFLRGLICADINLGKGFSEQLSMCGKCPDLNDFMAFPDPL